MAEAQLPRSLHTRHVWLCCGGFQKPAPTTELEDFKPRKDGAKVLSRWQAEATRRSPPLHPARPPTWSCPEPRARRAGWQAHGLESCTCPLELLSGPWGTQTNNGNLSNIWGELPSPDRPQAGEERLCSLKRDMQGHAACPHRDVHSPPVQGSSGCAPERETGNRPGGRNLGRR